MKFLIIALAVAISIPILVFSFRTPLKKGLAEMSYRPVIGEDFSDVKIVYADLFDHNSQTLKLAGLPVFSINTDTSYPVSPKALADLSQELRKEMILERASDLNEHDHSGKKLTLSLRTNQWQRILTEKKRIARLVIRPGKTGSVADISVAMSAEIPKEVIDAGKAQKSLRLFNQFLSLRREGVSPLGEDFHISYDEFINVYGYGQCHNQGYALMDLFERNGITARLVEINKPPHAVVEAEVELGVWATFDPLFGFAFIDPENNITFSFEQIRANVDTALKRFAHEKSEVRNFYEGTGIIVHGLETPESPADSYTFNLEQGQSAEYCFERAGYPWITTRNLTPPPSGVTGHFKMFWGEGTSFDIKTPYPLVDAEVSLPQDRPTIMANNSKEVVYDKSWDHLRLSRYINYERTLQLTSTKPVQLVTISQFSSLPYYRMTDGFIRISSSSDSSVEVDVEYLED